LIFNITGLDQLPGKKNRHPLYKRLVWPQDQCGRLLKRSPLPGFDPRTDHPVDSRNI